MIDFQPLKLSQRESVTAWLLAAGERGCEYTFTNLYLWGRQHTARVAGRLAFFSHFYGRSVYPFPVGEGALAPVIEAIIADSRERGIPCRLTGLTHADCQELEAAFPGAFRFREDRDGFDYVYAIQNLATLAGRKYQKKRNHVNKFRLNHPEARLLPLTEENLPAAREFAENWFRVRMEEAPEGTYLLERLAMRRAFDRYSQLSLEGAVLAEGDEILALTMATRMSEKTFDIHFEKARDDVDGAYPAVNQMFARYLLEKYPEVAFLNREDDLGLPGLRKAKESYSPHHMQEKFWAYLAEDAYDH